VTGFLLAAAVCWHFVSCHVVIGDLPLAGPAGGTAGGDSGTPDHAPADARADHPIRDVVTEADRDSADATADTGNDGFDAFDGSADVTDGYTEPCTTPVPWYEDADGDGYGRTDTEVVACPKPEGGAWARAPGDCYDGDARVHPGQSAYFGTPFSAGSGIVSFDYDCSGFEEPNPAHARFTGCGALSLALCEATKGYASGPRIGPGLDPYCGSTTVVECRSVLLQILVCEFYASAIADEPYRCR
jgi:hypothetical protein